VAAAAPIAVAASSEAPASSGCGAGAKAETADSKSECGADCVKACCAAYAYTYQVSGMTCGGCAAKVEKAAMAVDEKDIAACIVDYKAGTAVVTAREEMDTEQIAKAISATGFPAELVVEDDEKSGQKEKAPASDEDASATM
jgi:copper chaperone CopZ